MADWSGADAYARSYARLCAGAAGPLLDLVGTPAGRLLDVGSGPGTVALAARRRGWAVTAIEPDPEMRRVSAAAGMAAVEGALPDLPVPDGAAAAAVANLVVNHLPDPRAGLRGLARATRAGGLVGVSIWPASASAMPEVWDEVVRSSGAERPAGVRLDPALDFARTAAGLAGLLEDGGLADVLVTTARFDFVVAPEDLWESVEAGIGVIGTTWRAAPPAVRDRMREAFGRIAERRVDGAVLRFPAEALLARGAVPTR